MTKEYKKKGGVYQLATNMLAKYFSDKKFGRVDIPRTFTEEDKKLFYRFVPNSWNLRTFMIHMVDKKFLDSHHDQCGTLYWITKKHDKPVR